MEKTEYLKVSSNSNASKVAGALAAFLKERESIKIQAVGAGANNIVIKAVAIARNFLVDTGFDLNMKPSFKTLQIQGGERTAIETLVIKTKN